MNPASVSPTKTQDSPSRLQVVGIGASAGGLESLEQFFANLTPNPGMAFVVVQHLSPDFKSMMDELLSRHSDMPVTLAEHDVEVQPNHVYLLPPKKEMVIQNRRLLLSEKERMHGLTLPPRVHRRHGRPHLGQVQQPASNQRWCSDIFLIVSGNAKFPTCGN